MRTLTETNIRTRYLVGADGPRSSVARDFTLGINREGLHGVELHYAGVRGIDSDRLHVFLGRAAGRTPRRD